MSTQHIESRLEQRDLPYTPSQLAEIANKYNEDTAVIIGKRPAREGNRYGFEKIVLIVRNHQPATIMFRRESQNFDKRNFSVNRVVYL